MSKQKISKMVARVIEIKGYLEGVKSLYKELDELTLILAKVIPIGEQVGSIVIKDNFEEQNTVFRVHGVRRYEVEVIKRRGMK